MTNPNHTHITLLVDRTGSMVSLAGEASNAINKFIDDQAAEPGSCDLLLVDFDSNEPHRVVHDGPIMPGIGYHIDPRAMTPLFDAMGYTIRLTGERLAALDEDDRPGKVIFVVVTDGHENASHEYRRDQVFDLVSEHENRWSWEFVFLAVGPDAFRASQEFVGTQMADSNVTRSASTRAAYGATFSVASAGVAASRRGEDVAYGAEVDEDGNVT